MKEAPCGHMDLTRVEQSPMGKQSQGMLKAARRHRARELLGDHGGVVVALSWVQMVAGVQIQQPLPFASTFPAVCWLTALNPD